jgi:hypothetical protein
MTDPRIDNSIFTTLPIAGLFVDFRYPVLLMQYPSTLHYGIWCIIGPGEVKKYVVDVPEDLILLGGNPHPNRPWASLITSDGSLIVVDYESNVVLLRHTTPAHCYHGVDAVFAGDKLLVVSAAATKTVSMWRYSSTPQRFNLVGQTSVPSDMEHLHRVYIAAYRQTGPILTIIVDTPYGQPSEIEAFGVDCVSGLIWPLWKKEFIFCPIPTNDHFIAYEMRDAHLGLEFCFNTYSFDTGDKLLSSRYLIALPEYAKSDCYISGPYLPAPGRVYHALLRQGSPSRWNHISFGPSPSPNSGITAPGIVTVDITASVPLFGSYLDVERVFTDGIYTITHQVNTDASHFIVWNRHSV